LIAGRILGLPRRSHFPFAISAASTAFHLRLDVLACRAFGLPNPSVFPVRDSDQAHHRPDANGTAAVLSASGASHEVLSPSAHQAAPRCPDLPKPGRSRSDVSTNGPALASRPPAFVPAVFRSQRINAARTGRRTAWDIVVTMNPSPQARPFNDHICRTRGLLIHPAGAFRGNRGLLRAQNGSVRPDFAALLRSPDCCRVMHRRVPWRGVPLPGSGARGLARSGRSPCHASHRSWGSGSRDFSPLEPPFAGLFPQLVEAHLCASGPACLLRLLARPDLFSSG